MMAPVKDMQSAFYRHTFQRYEILAPNIFLEHSSNEMDLLGIRRSGFVDEVEIKMSKGDFTADFKKTLPGRYDQDTWRKIQINKHEELKSGNLDCNYFSFLMPVELAEKCEIPEYAGLYVYEDGGRYRPLITEVKKAPILHRRKISEHLKYQIGRKMAYRFWKTQYIAI